MKTNFNSECAIVLLLAAANLSAATHYVSLESTNPSPPYATWATAATNIQDAVDAAVAGDEIVVTNGTYASVAVDKPLVLRSVNGPPATLIDGGRADGCVYLTNGATLFGFTLTNGNAFEVGGGVYCESNAVVSNCVLSGNSVDGYFGMGGGAYGGTLNNCILTGNSAWGGRGAFGGGAAYATLNNCTVTGNSARADPKGRAIGGGAYACMLNNCIVYFNTASGGVDYDSTSTLDCCCTTPLPSIGLGNSTNAPLFVNYRAGNLHLDSHSPCVNAGNNAYVTTTTDLDGRPRIVGGTVDIGAYEYRALLVWQGSPTPTPPYATWTTAATNIQDAVDAAMAGDVVLVTNGTYAGGVAVTNPLTLLSVNGPQCTVINGGGTTGCAALGDGASLTGFTLTNGRSGDGAGVWCTSTNAFLTNCVMTGNGAEWQGGGAYGGTLYNCTLTGNGGDLGQVGSHVIGSGAFGSTLYNCTLTGNGFSGVASCTLYNCTLTGNDGGAVFCTLNNCIVYYNTAANGPNYNWGTTLDFCCTTPLPTNGVGNITNAPLFADQTNGNLRLQSNSPCLNAGNNAYVTTTTDLDGRPRIVGGTVDIGAYEFQPGASGAFIGWLEQYGLPTDGTADYADTDADGLNNWQEWRCGTCPTNANSALRLLAPQLTGTNVTVTWQSVAGVSYFLECSTNLSSTPCFICVVTNLPGQPGTTRYTDTAATNASPHFYRVGVGN